MKNYFKTLLIIIISALGYRFLETYLPNSLSLLLQFVYLVILLVIGVSMSPTHKRNNRWLGKVIVSLFVVFIFGIRLNLFVFDELYNGIKFLGLHGSFLDIMVLFSGWVFYQV